MCQDWLNDFEAFLAHIGPAPTPKHSIERIDNDKNYEPGNLRWATYTEQARNRSNNKKLMFQNLNLTIAEWAEKFGMRQQVIIDRLRRKWSIEDALTKPIELHPNSKPKRDITFNGKTQSTAQWSRETGIKRSTIEMRLDKYKWTPEEALTTPARHKS